MYRKLILIVLLTFSFMSCSKEESIVFDTENEDAYMIYQDAYKSFEAGDFFYANKRFSEAELNFKEIEFSAKSSIMSSYSLYGISFYSDALENLERYLKKYPADTNVMYAHYLIALIHYEQISDEKKDLQPLLDATKKIDFFINKYPNSDYSSDLKYKKDLIQNQLAAKELYVAKHYMITQKWIPAINRLKIIVKEYQKTVFIEEALHRLVEIHYYLGLEDEAKKYANILGYNYNSSEWFEQSYKILNKDYKIIKRKNASDKENKNFLKRIINKIK